MMPKRFEAQAEKIYNMEVRPTDTWLVSTQRSGTTLMCELIWQLNNNFNFKNTKMITMGVKFPSLEQNTLASLDFLEYMVKERPEYEAYYRGITTPTIDKLASQPTTTPRLIKSHLALSLLPPGLLDTAKVVYITRHPFDAAVSFYHLFKLLRTVSFNGSFSTFWQYYINGTLNCLPFFPHVKEAWAKKDHPNMLFLFYEDVIKDMPKTIRRVSSFLGKNISDEQVNMLAEHLTMENCKENPDMNHEFLMECGWMNYGVDGFVRKGKSGGWRSYFDVEMTRQAEQWITDNLQDTDLRLPEY